ncbi:MAG TPA: 50S ribosomal protein L11 methyltransferase [Desulfobacteraceae bacterium]|nr:50S ribosomal protein L11 methyltransferase [Desulfobacteraceae bacterium]
MNTTARWLKITVACPAAATEAVSDLIGLLSGVGVDIRPLPDQGVNAITGFFALESEAAADEWLKRVIPELNRLYGLYDLPPPSPNTEIIDDQDWATSWRQFFSAFEVIPGLVIKPSWEDDRPGENRRVIIMDPGMAFGTGQHASTRMALSLIAACFRNPTGSPPKTVLDVGTGTGILAMAAAVFGAERVTAVDNDPEAVGIATDNIRANGLEGIIDVSGRSPSDLPGPCDLICANIVHDVLAEMAPELGRLLGRNGRLVLSGILRGEQEQHLARLYGANSMKTLSVEYQGEWAAMLLAGA